MLKSCSHWISIPTSLIREIPWVKPTNDV
jgi:hypothetical protein